MKLRLFRIATLFSWLNKRQQNTLLHIIGSLSRTVLAVTFLFSGFVKAVDPLGTVYKVQDYLAAFTEHFGSFFEHLVPFAGTLAVTLIVIEFVLGWLLLFNVRTSVTSWVTLAFMLVMTPITWWLATTNAVSDCGCFGDAIKLTNWQTFYKNVILLGLVLILLFTKKTIPQLFSWWAELGLLLIGLGGVAGVMGYSYTHLPIIDFRPYKVGANLVELTQAPETDTTVVMHVMEKDGVRKQVANEDYMAAIEEGWTWKEQTSTPCKKVGNKLEPIESQDPPITDFIISEFFGEDDGIGVEVTKEILELDTVTLICMHDVVKANKKQADRAVALYKQLHNQYEKCYILTSSSTEEVRNFAKANELEDEAFLYLDRKPLETVIRANPGVVVLEKGVIKSKTNMRQVKL